MKYIKRNWHKTILSCLLLSSLSLTSCEKDEGEFDCVGKPVITGVSKADRSSTITEGDYNQFVIINGDNLCSVKKLMFNDVEVSVSEIYATANEITVKIPNNAPDTQTNKVTVETHDGQAEHEFTVKIPPVAILKVDNEYAPVGTNMVLVGQSFDFGGYTKGNGKIYFGSKEATIARATVDSLIVTVPSGATSGDVIKGVAKNGTVFTYQYPYRDETNMVVNYDDKPTAAWSRADYVGQDPLPGPISGNYAHFVEPTLRTGFAQDQFFKGKVTLPQDAVDNPGKYVIKFEVNTSLPVKNAGIRIFADVPSNKYYAWSPTTALPFDTKGKWVTHTISLQDANGKTAPLAARPENLYELRGLVTTGVSFAMDISFDNWRVVEKPAL